MERKSNNKDQLSLDIISYIKKNKNTSQRALAGDLNVSIGSVNFCIRALIDKGLIKVQNFRKSNNKLAYAYILTPAGISEKLKLTKIFLNRKQQEYEILQKEINHLKQQIKIDENDKK